LLEHRELLSERQILDRQLALQLACRTHGFDNDHQAAQHAGHVSVTVEISQENETDMVQLFCTPQLSGFFLTDPGRQHGLQF